MSSGVSTGNDEEEEEEEGGDRCQHKCQRQGAPASIGVGSWRKRPRQVMCPRRHCKVQHRSQIVASTQALAPECYGLEVGSWRRRRQMMRVKRHCHLQHQSLTVASQDTRRHQLNAGMQLVPTPWRDSEFLPGRGTRAISVSLRPCLFLDVRLFYVPRKNLYVV